MKQHKMVQFPESAAFTLIWQVFRFTTGLSYYVIAFSTGDFFGSKYWNLAAAGFVDIPASFLAVFIVSR